MRLLLQNQPRSQSIFQLASSARAPCRPFSQNDVQVEKKAEKKTKLEGYDGPLVISCISWRFPNANSIKEATSKLLQGQELNSETSLRWNDGRRPKRMGFLNCLDKFNAGFFGITPNQVHQIDPQTRLLLDVAFEAIIDAGINPTAFKASRTAVFTGAYGGEPLSYFQMRHNRDAIGHQYASHSFMTPAAGIMTHHGGIMGGGRLVHSWNLGCRQPEIANFSL